MRLVRNQETKNGRGLLFACILALSVVPTSSQADGGLSTILTGIGILADIIGFFQGRNLSDANPTQMAVLQNRQLLLAQRDQISQLNYVIADMSNQINTLPLVLRKGITRAFETDAVHQVYGRIETIRNHIEFERTRTKKIISIVQFQNRWNPRFFELQQARNKLMQMSYLNAPAVIAADKWERQLLHEVTLLLLATTERSAELKGSRFDFAGNTKAWEEGTITLAQRRSQFQSIPRLSQEEYYLALARQAGSDYRQWLTDALSPEVNGSIVRGLGEIVNAKASARDYVSGMLSNIESTGIFQKRWYLGEVAEHAPPRSKGCERWTFCKSNREGYRDHKRSLLTALLNHEGNVGRRSTYDITFTGRWTPAGGTSATDQKRHRAWMKFRGVVRERHGTCPRVTVAYCDVFSRSDIKRQLRDSLSQFIALSDLSMTRSIAEFRRLQAMEIIFEATMRSIENHIGILEADLSPGKMKARAVEKLANMSGFPLCLRVISGPLYVLSVPGTIAGDAWESIVAKYSGPSSIYPTLGKCWQDIKTVSFQLQQRSLFMEQYRFLCLELDERTLYTSSRSAGKDYLRVSDTVTEGVPCPDFDEGLLQLFENRNRDLSWYALTHAGRKSVYFRTIDFRDSFRRSIYRGN